MIEGGCICGCGVGRRCVSSETRQGGIIQQSNNVLKGWGGICAAYSRRRTQVRVRRSAGSSARYPSSYPVFASRNWQDRSPPPERVDVREHGRAAGGVGGGMFEFGVLSERECNRTGMGG